VESSRTLCFAQSLQCPPAGALKIVAVDTIRIPQDNPYRWQEPLANALGVTWTTLLLGRRSDRDFRELRGRIEDRRNQDSGNPIHARTDGRNQIGPQCPLTMTASRLPKANPGGCPNVNYGLCKVRTLVGGRMRACVGSRFVSYRCRDLRRYESAQYVQKSRINNIFDT